MSLAISVYDQDMMRLADAQLLQYDQFGLMTALKAYHALTDIFSQRIHSPPSTEAEYVSEAACCNH